MDRVNGANTVDIGGGRRGFRSQNAAAGIAGTEVTAKFMNDVQEEICKVIAEAGIELDPGSQQQLYEALLAISAPGYGNRSPWLPVISKTVSVPPNDAETGDTYCIPAGATGAWTGKSQDIAEWTGSTWRIFTAKDGHGIGLPDGTVFIRIGGVYVEWLASRNWVEGRKTPIGQLNSLPWLPVKSITLAAPPANASEGDLYIVAAGANGAWTGKAGQIAEWSEATWKFSLPTDGHGVSLPDGRIFERIGGAYVEKIALDVQSGKWSYAEAGGTANALTATLTPVPSALTSGFSVALTISNKNTGPVTLNVNGLGAVPVVTSTGRVLSAGDLVPGLAYVFYDGSEFRIVGSTALIRGGASYTVAGTYSFTVPDGVYWIEATVVGAGGGGGGCLSSVNAAGGGGGAGSSAQGVFAVTPGQTVPITIGLGGAGGIGATTSAQTGGTTSFGGFAAASGGGPAANSNGGSTTGGGGGAVTTGGDSRGPGEGGTFSFSIAPSGTAVSQGGLGGSSILASSPGGGATVGLSATASNGTSGSMGAGGSGGAVYNSIANGGKGGDGAVILRW